MTSPSIPTKHEQGTKPDLIGLDAAGEFIWSRRPTPAQDAAWIERQHEWRDRSLSFARLSSKLSVKNYRWAAESSNPDRAAHYAAEGRRLRRKAREYLREARNRSV